MNREERRAAARDAKRGAVGAATQLADDIAHGRVDAEALDAAVVAECRALAFQAVGAGDPLWDDQVELARAVLALGGIPGNELSEWAAVQLAAEGSPPERSWIERALAEYPDDEPDV